MHSHNLTLLWSPGKAKVEVCRVLLRFCEVWMKLSLWLGLADFSLGCEFFWFRFSITT